ALGLASLARLDEAMRLRRQRHDLYRQLPLGLPGLRLQRYDGDRYNFSYFPLLFSDEPALLSVQEALRQMNVFARRYFHPSLNQMPMFTGACALPIAEDLSRRVRCLPLYPHLSLDDVRRIAAAVRNGAS